MDTYEAKELLADSLRCLCRSMEQIRLREIEKVVGYDEPMQDHLAECTWAIVPYEDTSVEECLEYLKLLYKGFEQASNHTNTIEKSFNLARFDVAHICDMVFGMIGHGFPKELVKCATEIHHLFEKKMHALGHYTKSEKGCEKLIGDFIPEAIEIMDKYGYKDWKDGEYSISVGYLISWTKRQYYGE